MNRQAFEARIASLAEVTAVPAAIILQAPTLVVAALEQAIRERDLARAIIERLAMSDSVHDAEAETLAEEIAAEIESQ